MKKNYGLTNTERVLMELLWKEAKPVTFREILDVATKEWGKEWKPQTLNTFLRGLQKMGMIRAEKSLISGYNVYYALVTKEQHIHKWTRELVEVYYHNSIVYLAKAYIGDGQLSGQEKEELKEFIASHIDS